MTPLILGTAQLVTDYGDARTTPAMNFDEAVKMIQLAEELGYAGIDTAPGYGSAEKVIGVAQVKLPVYTKLDHELDPVESMDLSLRNLGRDFVDGVFLHDPNLVIEDPCGIIDKAHEMVGGMTMFLGASVYTTKQIETAMMDERIDAIQAPYYAKLPIGNRKQVFVRSVFGRGRNVVPSRIKRVRDVPGLTGMLIGIDNPVQLVDTFNIWNTP